MYFSRLPAWECHEALITPSYRQTKQLMPDYADILGTERGWQSTDMKDTGLLLTHWLRLVEIYSRCALTHPGDKLIAMSGLAKSFSSLLNGEYYAGIWGGDYLVPCLLWFPDGPSGPFPRSTYLGLSHCFCIYYHTLLT